MFLKAQSIKDVFLHLLIMVTLFILAVVFFFYIYLPMTTNHGEKIIVPKLTGMTVSEIESVLSAHKLRYQVNDSSYIPDAKPNTVLAQHPSEGSQVKENRKIYISISSVNPPKIKMPSLVDGSLKNAEIALKSYGLELGKIKTIPSPYMNLVVDQLIDGKSIKPGTYISKGTKVDLAVGDGSKGVEVQVPHLIGMDLESARVKLAEIGLDFGLVEKDNTSSQSPGTITKQSPSTGTLKSGEMLDVWVAQ